MFALLMPGTAYIALLAIGYTPKYRNAIGAQGHILHTACNCRVVTGL